MNNSHSELRSIKLFCRVMSKGVTAQGLRIAGEVGVPEGQLATLRFLVNNPTSTLADVASALKVTPPAVTRLLDGLVSRGMVKRSQSSVDRRALELVATDRAKELIRRIETAEEEALEDLLELLSPEEKGELFKGIAVFMEAIVEGGSLNSQELCLRCGEAHGSGCILAQGDGCGFARKPL